ncbi:Uncharacterized protein APZ42_017047 [Daphnia magna]|uniref:Uncharacterized protein n=1 Tax=Daphnia magna TaxID=35525 RepID=A0A165AB10_9CRUS|nr:Uncharacterized protein APZ42_017047 [Daphnia magna]
MYIPIDRMMADGRKPCRISKDIPARDGHAQMNSTHSQHQAAADCVRH